MLDAKYKAIDEGLMKHHDAYQMLAYCTAYGLVAATSSTRRTAAPSRGRTWSATPNVDIVVEMLDVTREPEGLLEQVRSLASRIAAAASAASIGSSSAA